MKLQEILKSLDSSEKMQLNSLLKNDIGLLPQLNSIEADVNKVQKPVCPHCHSSEICSHGKYKGRKRYICKGCEKTFNDLTGKTISGIRKTDKFLKYLELTIESVTIRKAAKHLGVNMKTIIDWRQKMLTAVSTMNGPTFSLGIAESSDKNLNIYKIGKRNTDRTSCKRSVDKKMKQSDSNDKVSLMVTSDGEANPEMRVAKMKKIDVEATEKTTGDLIKNSNVHYSDIHPFIVSWSKDKEPGYHTFISSKQHVKNKCHHSQHENSLEDLYEKWIKPFYRASNNYLPHILTGLYSCRKLKRQQIQ